MATFVGYISDIEEIFKNSSHEIRTQKIGSSGGIG